MTNRERLLIGLLAENEHRSGEPVSEFEVVIMLCALGEEYRRNARRQFALAT